MANWKKLERDVAKTFGVQRVSRANDFSQDIGDTTAHPHLSIEIKYRKNLPKFLMDGIAQAKRYHPTKIPILCTKEKGKHGCIVSLHLDDFLKFYKAWERLTSKEVDRNSQETA